MGGTCLFAWAAGGALVVATAAGILYVEDMPSLFWLGSLVNVALSVVKMGLVQVSTHRKALLADAVHGLGDTVAEIITALAFQEAARPPDSEHPWGHGKIEAVGAVIVGCLLLYIAASMGWDSVSSIVQMLRNSDADQAADARADGVHGDALGAGNGRLVRQAVVAVTLASVTLKEALFFSTLRAGAHSQSKLAVATAWHHRSDSLAAGVALVSQVGASMGQFYLDPLGGGIVAGMLVHSATSSLADSLDDLLDYNPASDREDKGNRCGHQVLSKSIVAIQGIRNHSLRTRRMGPYCLVDVTINVDARISASAASTLAEAVHDRVIADFWPFVTDVLVHVDPDGSPQSHDVHTHAENAARELRGLSARATPDEVEARVREAVFAQAAERPDLPRVAELTELQSYYYADDEEDGGSGAYVYVKIDIRLETDRTTTVQTASLVARAVRHRILAALPGLVRAVDVDLELDELDEEVAASSDSVTAAAAEADASAPDAARASRPRRSLFDVSASPGASRSCSVDGRSHGSWGGEACVAPAPLALPPRGVSAAPRSATLLSSGGRGAETPRELQKVTLIWERGVESRQARVPTMRFEHKVRWTPMRSSWLGRFGGDEAPYKTTP